MIGEIEPGNVIRWFSINWEFFGGPQAGTDKHDLVFDTLLSMRNAVEVNSGHTGVNIAFENITRPNSKMIEDIKRKLARFSG